MTDKYEYKPGFNVLPPESLPKLKSGSGKSEVGAGRGRINPKPVGMAGERYVTPKEHYDFRKQMLELQERKKTDAAAEDASKDMGMKKGGYVKAADGCAKRGKTRGKMV